MAEAGSSKAAGNVNLSTFDVYNANVQRLALEATKLAAGFPLDVAFHRSVDAEFAKAVDGCSEKALRLTNRLISLVEDASASKSGQGKGKARLGDEEDVKDKFGSIVVDVLDQLFERVDTCLDNYHGLSKPAAIAINPVVKASKTKTSRSGRLDPTITHASHLPKPQAKFSRRVDNTNGPSWSPGLKHKYNAQVPLGHIFVEENAGEDVQVQSGRMHPYHYEIKHISYPKHMFEQRDPIQYGSFDDVPFTWVETKDVLEEMIGKLRQSKEIAVDLEHHSYRTFRGFLCLMQISTREEDFIVDTLKLREELEELNEVFTNPKIVKVFHGAESDIVWLQQDFNLYIVNLFDTFHASKALDFNKHGLAALLEMYCDFIPDKRYQLADWRIRPLPTEMLHYARSDTHFLLYIYDNLRNALLDRGGSPPSIKVVLSRSEDTSLRTYEHETYDVVGGAGPSGWDTLAQKWNKSLFGVQLEVFKAVHAWRDRVAREEDESTRFVLPNHFIFQLAEQPPADMPALLARFRPVPPLVRSKAADLVDTIRQAVQRQEENPVTLEVAMEADKEADMQVEVVESAVSTSSESRSSLASLWTKKTSAENITASSSAFLGNSTKSVKGASATSQSSLFPSGWSKINCVRASQRYQEVVARIHGAMAVAPSAPTPSVAIHVEATKPDIDTSDPTELPEQIEIPFIPASARQPKIETVEDSIVVVGQPRQKKRKRVKGLNTDDGSKETTPGTGGQPSKKARSKEDEGVAKTEAEADVIEPFDYTTVPNLLDDSPVAETEINGKGKKGKSKGRKGLSRGFETGGFPAAPRANHEVKSGNQSHTFKR